MEQQINIFLISFIETNSYDSDFNDIFESLKGILYTPIDRKDEIINVYNYINDRDNVQRFFFDDSRRLIPLSNFDIIISKIDKYFNIIFIVLTSLLFIVIVFIAYRLKKTSFKEVRSS